MSFPYTRDIPDPPNNPSVDVPIMKVNANTIDSWTDVDHIGFNNSQGGKHKQVTIVGNNIPVAQPPTLTSEIYTNNGIADATRPQLFWQNFNSWVGTPTPLLVSPIQLSAVRAWATVTQAGTINTNQSSNVASVTNPSTGHYTVTLKDGATSSDVYAVLLTGQPNSPGNLVNVFSYQVTSITTFTVFSSQPENTAISRNAPFSFIVLQI